ncbi:MAG TPA: PP2C family protein-serine/threonine phosphatase [Blastocatellia bacterium]|nr:PP2C family protein-serine/threonine phosphatase [Blastocatellia bacterium]
MTSIASRHRFGRVSVNPIDKLKDKLVAMKQLKDRLPKQVDEALNEQARAAEGWATKARWLFAVIFAASAIWTWNNPLNAKYIYLQLAGAWMVMAAVGAVSNKSPDANLTTMTMIDLTIVHLGLAAFVWRRLFPGLGSDIFLCYFPILAIAANRRRMSVALKAAAYAGVGYAAISLWAGSSPFFRVTLLFMTAFVFVRGSSKPKDLAVNIAGKAIEEAFDLGARRNELDLVQKAHQLFLPPPIVDLPEIWVSSKHGAGTETGGDYFHIFETPGGPLVAAGDLGGRGFEALGEVADLHQRLAKIISRETDLPKILEELNEYLLEKYGGRRTFTCALARWEGEKMRYVNAGHLPMIQMSKPQGAQTINHKQLPVTCGPVGAQVEATFTESVVQFPARDQLVIYTDGVFAKITDSRDKGVSEVEALAEKFSGAEVTTLCHRIFDCAQPGYDQNRDDSTVVVIRRQSVAAAASASTEGKA